ncbi:MAG: tripartite tricarboxylate transporter substrate binding protein [Burkholderiaceae bacterium]|nr:tripartite tricarboxylate transporter substrate binding protein [Burkholderiaceae bacterium]
MWHLSRRNFATAALGLAGALAVGTTFAQSYPSKPIRLIVGYQAGGPTDMTARLIATKLQTALGQPVIVENKVGAGSNIASEFVAASPPDGYTLLLAAAPITMNGFLYKNLKWDVQKSFEPIVNVMTAPSVLAVATKLPVRSVSELVALAKRQPGKLTFGSTGNGGSQHLAGELLKQRAGIDLLHIPYKGASAALNDLMAGQVDMVFMTSMSALPHLKSGNPRPIAVASAKRLPQLPDVPTVAESGFPGFEAESWNGLFAPAKTPPEIIARLNAEVNKALTAPDLREMLVSQGAVLVGGSSADFRQYIGQEVVRWGRLLKTLKVSMD